ncbi:MAG: 2TM domain-containing protein [Actinomycetota bacterium]
MFNDASMRIFLGHLVAYIAVTLICAGVNLWLSPSTLWWPWVLIGWGVAVAIHAFALLLRKTRRRERIFIDRKARAFAVHLFAYVAVVLALLFVNVTLMPGVWWFYWVALGWGAGVLAQGLCVFRRRKPPRSEVTQPETKRVETKPKPPEGPKSEPPRKSPPHKRAPSKRKPKT